MNRQERRAMQRELRKESAAFPPQLVRVPESEWPARDARFAEWPVAVWRSRDYLVQVFPAPPHGEVETLRLSVNRTAMRADGHWQQDIPWEDLQRLKREAGYGAWYGVEVYPCDRDIVAICNMRHLWLFSEPLNIGWFGPDGMVGI